MHSEAILARVRRYLLILAAAVFIMTLVELMFVSHWNKRIQYLPFALCLLGLVTLLLVAFRPSRGRLKVLRGSMAVIGVCSLIGFHQHMLTNYTFWVEIRPTASTWELAVATVNGGVPVLAPGILLLGAAIGLTAIYRHPGLEA